MKQIGKQDQGCQEIGQMRLAVAEVVLEMIADHATQIFDDLHNYWYQGDGYTDLFGIEIVELSVDGLRRFFKALDKGFALVRALDHLIALVSDPETDRKDIENDRGSR